MLQTSLINAVPWALHLEQDSSTMPNTVRGVAVRGRNSIVRLCTAQVYAWRQNQVRLVAQHSAERIRSSEQNILNYAQQY